MFKIQFFANIHCEPWDVDDGDDTGYIGHRTGKLLCLIRMLRIREIMQIWMTDTQRDMQIIYIVDIQSPMKTHVLSMTYSAKEQYKEGKCVFVQPGWSIKKI